MSGKGLIREKIIWYVQYNSESIKILRILENVRLQHKQKFKSKAILLDCSIATSHLTQSCNSEEIACHDGLQHRSKSFEDFAVSFEQSRTLNHRRPVCSEIRYAKSKEPNQIWWASGSSSILLNLHWLFSAIICSVCTQHTDAVHFGKLWRHT